MSRLRFSSLALCLVFAAGGPVLAEDSPEAAYWDYLEALQSGNVASVNECVSQKWRDEMADAADDLEELLGMMAMFMPENIRIEDSQVGADNSTATLRLVGKSQMDGKDMFGTVRLVKEDGRWKIDEEAWTDEASG